MDHFPCSHLHVLLPPLGWCGLAMSKQIQMIHSEETLPFVATTRFVASSLCEGAPSVPETIVNTLHSQNSHLCVQPLTSNTLCTGKLSAYGKYSLECKTPWFCPVAPTLKLKLMHLHTNL